MRKVLVTGATSGIGLATAKALANAGCQLILFGRKPEGKSVIELELPSNATYRYYAVDFANLDDVRDVSEELLQVEPQIEVIINNAGCVSSERVVVANNLEKQNVVNHLAPFVLTVNLLGSLLKAGGRVVQVSSRAHARASIDMDNVLLQKGYSLSKAYNQSKLMNMMCMIRLSKLLDSTDVTVNAFHPGLVNTSIGSKNTNTIHWIGWSLMKILGRRPQEAAKDAVFLSLDNSLRGVNGKYFYKGEVIKPSKKTRDKELMDSVWKWTLAASGVSEERILGEIEQFQNEQANNGF